MEGFVGQSFFKANHLANPCSSGLVFFGIPHEGAKGSLMMLGGMVVRVVHNGVSSKIYPTMSSKP